jgi:hypothetical protein
VQFELTNIDHFKLVSNFCIISNEHGGSFVHIKDYIQTKEQN